MDIAEPRVGPRPVNWSPCLLQAHKALLATQSDYFRVMFTADMRERDQDKIHMKGLTAAGFGHILRFMYYGSLELSMPTVQEILQVFLCDVTTPEADCKKKKTSRALTSSAFLPLCSSVPGRQPCTCS